MITQEGERNKFMSNAVGYQIGNILNGALFNVPKKDSGNTMDAENAPKDNKVEVFKYNTVKGVGRENEVKENRSNEGKGKRVEKNNNMHEVLRDEAAEDDTEVESLTLNLEEENSLEDKGLKLKNADRLSMVNDNLNEMFEMSSSKVNIDFDTERNKTKKIHSIDKNGFRSKNSCR